MLSRLIMLMKKVAAFLVDAADFDGTNDVMTRGAGLTGAADSKIGTLVFWFRADGNDASVSKIISGLATVGSATARGVFVSRDATPNIIKIQARNAATALILDLTTTSSFATSATWFCCMSSWDLVDTAKRHLYIGDSSEINVNTYTNDTIDYTVADWSVGAFGDVTQPFSGCFAEFWFAPGQYIDFSAEANRRLFFSASGKPVSLGTDGSTPTGTAPLVFFHLDNGEAVANFATNRGSGGNFTITGTLDTASTSPSD